MKKKIALALSLIMLAGTVCLSGCGNNGGNTSDTGNSSTSGTESAIRIGGIGPVTGGAAAYGMAVKNGAQIAVDEINAKGEIKLELNFQDDENDAEKSVSAYNTLKDWKMHMLLGTVTTTPCLAISPETYSDRIFQITPSASSPQVIEGHDNVFQVCFSDPNQGTASAQYIAEKALATKIGIIYRNDDAYSTGIFESFKAEAEKLGLDIVSVTTFTNDTASDFSVQINDAKSKGADLLFLPIYYEPASLILAQAKSADFAPLFFGVDGMDGILSLENFDKSLAEGVILLTPFSADSEDAATKSFVEKYQSAHGEIPNQFAADAYDAVYAIAEAVKKSGVTADMSAADMCDKLAAAMTEIKIDGITGAGSQLTWNDKGEVSKAPMAVVIKDGVYVGY
ncbi:MAG: ABC transporter substrate-binding protein [Clostridiales bacterium]|nr:ABC transporter substrate-binding protein [Clostridiales bacterium]